MKHRGSFCGYSYQHNDVAQPHELPEQAGEGLLWRKVMQQRSWAAHFGCNVINESHSEKFPSQSLSGTRHQSPNLMCCSSEQCLAPRWKNSVPASAALPRQHRQLQTHFRRRNGEYKRLKRDAAALQKCEDMASAMLFLVADPPRSEGPWHQCD